MFGKRTKREDIVRHIALLGNRQQSRFLALVSSYDRLKELSAEAADSEDAAQLQYLKTLDSIEAKQQQLQTSIQSLYVEGGLQDFYKWLLDIGNNIIKTFTEMPVAILKVAEIFISLSSVVRALGRVISTVINNTAQRITTTAEQEYNKRKAIEEQGIIDLKNIEEEKLANEEDYERRRTEIARKYRSERRRIETDQVDNNQKDLSTNKTANGWIMAGHVVGSLASMASLAIEPNTAGATALKSILDIGGSAASLAATGASIGAMLGNPLAGAIIGGIIGGLQGVLQNLHLWTQSEEDKIKELKENIENAKNARIKSTSEVKTLQNYKAKYDELKIAQYGSNEAKQEFIDLQNEIVNQYPELLSYIDAEGNAIADLGDAYKSLYNRKVETSREDIIKEAKANVEALRNVGYIYTNIMGQEALKNTEGLAGWNFDNYSGILSTIDYSSKNQNIYQEQILSQLQGWGDITDTARRLANNNNLGFGEWSGAAQDLSWIITYFASAASEQLKIKDAREFVKKRTFQNGLQQTNSYDQSKAEIIENFDPEFYSELMGRFAAERMKTQLEQNQVSQTGLELLTLNESAINLTRDEGITQLQRALLHQELLNEFKKYQKEEGNQNKTASELINDFFKDYGTIEWELRKLTSEPDIYNSLTEEQEQFYANITKYTINDLKILFDITDIEEDSLAGKMRQLLEEKSKQYKKDYLEFVTSDISKAFAIKDFSEKFGGEYLGYIQYSQQQILNNSSLTEAKKRQQLTNLNNLYEGIANLDSSQRNQALDLISTADLTSIEGVYNLIDSFKNAGIDINARLGESGNTIEKLLLGLSNDLIINFETSFASFADNLISQSQDFDKALSKASKGMDLKEASDFIQQMRLTLGDLTFKEGKYFYDVAEGPKKIQEAYFQFNQDLKKRLDSEYDSLVGEQGLLRINSYHNNQKLLDIFVQDLEGKTEEEQAEYLSLVTTTKDGEQLLALYNQYYDSWDKEGSFNDYVIKQLSESYENMQAAIDQYGIYQVNAILIQNGYITTFLNNLGINDNETIRKIQDAIQAGDIETLVEKGLSDYITVLLDQNKDVTKNIYSQLNDIIKNDNKGYIKAEDFNFAENTKENLKDFLTPIIDNSTEEIIGYAVKVTTENLQEYINIIQQDEYLTDEEKISQASDAWNAVYSKMTELSAMSTLISSTSISGDAAIELVQALGETDDNLGAIMLTYGYVFNEATQQYEKVNKITEEQIQQLKERLAQLQQNGAPQSEVNELEQQLFDWENQINKNITDNLKEIISNRESVSSDQIKKFATSLELDFNQALEYFEKNNDGTFRIDISAIKRILKNSTIEIGENVEEYLNELIYNIIDDYLDAISSGVGYITSGLTKQADMRKFVNDFNNKLNTTYNISDLFGWDTILEAYTLKPEYLAQYIAKQRELLKTEFDNDADVDKYIESQLKSITQAVDISNFLQSENTQNNSRSRKVLENQMRTALSIQANWKQAENYIDGAIEMLASGTGGNYELIYEEAWKIAIEEANKQNEKINDEINTEVKNDLSNFEKGGQAAVEILKKYAGDRELTAEEIEAAYRTRLNNLSTAFESIATLQRGNVVDQNTRAILNDINGFFIDMNGVVLAVGNMVDAYKEIYEQMKNTSIATTSELNSAYAKLLTAEDQNEINAIEALGNAMGMTYDALGQLLSQYNMSLEMVIKNSRDFGIEQLGAGKIRINDFKKFATQMGWNPDSEEYWSAFKTYNDSLIELNKNAKTAIEDEVKSLKDAKGGDQINLTSLWRELSKVIQKELEEVANNFQSYGYEGLATESLFTKLAEFGASFINGVLTLDNDANIIQVTKILTDYAEQAGIAITEEMQDTLQSIIKAYSDAIIKGIQGGMTNVEAADLQNKALSLGISKIDFTATAEGLKLSQQSAIELYYVLSNIDSLQAQLVFKELNESLKESNEHYKTMSSLMTHIKELQDAINNADSQTNPARIQQYKQELELAKDIAKVRLTTEDSSFDFMSADLDGALNNAPKYYEAWAKAVKSASTAAKNGYIGWEDYARMVNEVQNLAVQTGENMVFMGQTISSDGTSAAKLIEQGYHALDIDVESGTAVLKLKSLLTETGLDFKQGAKGFDASINEGIQEFAQGQVKMLDGMIQLLETIVAMEQLGDIDADTFSFFDGEDFSKNYQNFINYATKSISDGNTDLEKAFNNTKINGKTLTELIGMSSDELSTYDDDFQKAYANVLIALNKAAQSGDWDTAWDVIKEQLAASGVDGLEIDLDNVHYVFKNGIMLEKNEKGFIYNGKTYNTSDEAWLAIVTSNLTALQGMEVVANDGTTIEFTGPYNVKISYDKTTYTAVIDGTTLTSKTQEGLNYAILAYAQAKDLQSEVIEEPDEPITFTIVKEGEVGVEYTLSLVDDKPVISIEGNTNSDDEYAKALQEYFENHPELFPGNTSLPVQEALSQDNTTNIIQIVVNGIEVDAEKAGIEFTKKPTTPGSIDSLPATASQVDARPAQNASYTSDSEAAIYNWLKTNTNLTEAEIQATIKQIAPIIGTVLPTSTGLSKVQKSNLYAIFKRNTKLTDAEIWGLISTIEPNCFNTNTSKPLSEEQSNYLKGILKEHTTLTDGEIEGLIKEILPAFGGVLPVSTELTENQCKILYNILKRQTKLTDAEINAIISEMNPTWGKIEPTSKALTENQKGILYGILSTQTTLPAAKIQAIIDEIDTELADTNGGSVDIPNADAVKAAIKSKLRALDLTDEEIEAIISEIDTKLSDTKGEETTLHNPDAVEAAIRSKLLSFSNDKLSNEKIDTIITQVMATLTATKAEQKNFDEQKIRDLLVAFDLTDEEIEATITTIKEQLANNGNNVNTKYPDATKAALHSILAQQLNLSNETIEAIINYIKTKTDSTTLTGDVNSEDALREKVINLLGGENGNITIGTIDAIIAGYNLITDSKNNPKYYDEKGIFKNIEHEEDLKKNQDIWNDYLNEVFSTGNIDNLELAISMVDLLTGFGAVDEDGKFIFGSQAGQATLNALGLTWENGRIYTGNMFTTDGKLDLGTFNAKVATSEIQLEGAQIISAELNEEEGIQVAEISLIDGQGNPYIVKVPAEALIDKIDPECIDPQTGKIISIGTLSIDIFATLQDLDEGEFDNWVNKNTHGIIITPTIMEEDTNDTWERKSAQDAWQAIFEDLSYSPAGEIPEIYYKNLYNEAYNKFIREYDSYPDDQVRKLERSATVSGSHNQIGWLLDFVGTSSIFNQEGMSPEKYLDFQAISDWGQDIYKGSEETYNDWVLQILNFTTQLKEYGLNINQALDILKENLSDPQTIIREKQREYELKQEKQQQYDNFKKYTPSYMKNWFKSGDLSYDIDNILGERGLYDALEVVAELYDYLNEDYFKLEEIVGKDLLQQLKHNYNIADSYHRAGAEILDPFEYWYNNLKEVFDDDLIFSNLIDQFEDKYGHEYGAAMSHMLSSGIEYSRDEFDKQVQEIIEINTTQIEEPDLNISVGADTSNAEKEIISFRQNIKDNPETLVINAKVNNTETGIVGAKGNVALAQGTLMGELGPELYVSGGRYFVAGQNGAEMVNLPDDAIVFNHLQTKQLLTHGSTGRGKPTTNEKNAVSFAKGGPAQASASSALATLKQLRAQWQALANLSVADLASQAGSGGGGDDNLAIFIKDVERWYNWLQKIARLEEQITYQEQLRAEIESELTPNGKAYYVSQKASLKALKEQAATASSLASSQEDFYKKRMRDLENSPFARFYEFDEFGQIKYKSSGFTELSQLLSTNDQGLPNYTAEQQYNWLISQGYGDFMKYDSSGQEIKKEDDEQTFFENSVKAFFDRLDSEKEELQGLHDSIEEQKKAVLEKIEKINELIKEMRDNQKDVENSVLKAIEESREREIKKIEDTKDALQDSNEKLVEHLSNQLEKERKLYEKNQNDEELNRMRRQLSILQRSGGSAAEIASLQKQIEEASKDQYFEKQQEQIDAVKEASDLQIERMDHQIELMNEQLEYQKANGLLWTNVYEVMSKSPQEIAYFIKENTSEFWSKSPIAFEDDVGELIFKTERWTELRDDVNGIYDILNMKWNIFAGEMEEEFGSGWNNVSDENKAIIKQIFDAKLAETGDYNAAAAAARQSSVYQDLKKQQKADTELLNINNTTQTQQNQITGTQWKYTITWNKGSGAGEEVFGLGFAEDDESAKAWAKYYAMQKVPKNAMYTSAGKFEKIYKNGGLIDYTGPAWVDGTKQKPESIWDADTTKLLKDNLFNTSKLNLLSSFWDTLQGYETVANHSYSTNSESLIIENAVVNMNVASIANDYDARRAGEQAMEEMLRIARKTRVSNF